ncbi:MAG: MBL fold metallo-hydrolase [Lentisphaeraceae bacterium]|nr:MBL fold metallo-hydrolase [Lentisphaeraceae bacterium]
MIGLASLSSGSKGNCTVVRNGEDLILIDCGLSFKKLREKLKEHDLHEEMIKAIFVTHEHTDHVSGLRVTSDKMDIPVFCNQNTGAFLKRKERAPQNLNYFENGSSIGHSTFVVEPFSVPHDGVDTVAYNVYVNDIKISVATDFGFASQAVKQNLKGCDLLLLESNHDVKMLQECDKRPWKIKQRILSRHGHFSNETCHEILSDVLHKDLKHLILGHVSQDTNDYLLVHDLAQKHLELSGYGQLGMHVALQNEVSPFFTV